MVKADPMIPSNADFLRGSLRVPAPQMSAETRGKNVDQSQHTSRSRKCTLDLEKFPARLQKISKRSHERWRSYTFRTNYSVNSHAFVQRKYTKWPPLSPTFSTGAKLFGHVSHSTELVRRVWLVHTLNSTAPIGSPIVSTWAPAISRTMGKEIYRSFHQTFEGQERANEPPRTSTWEASLIKTFLALNYHDFKYDLLFLIEHQSDTCDLL